MATRFAADAEIGASPPPFRSMRSDPSATCPKLREQMGQFVAQGTIDLGFAVRAKTTVKQDTRGPVLGATGGATQT